MKKLMKIISQMVIIYLIYLSGNLLNTLLLPIINIPGSILAMLILFTLLVTGLLKLDKVELTGNFLLKYMSFFFVPFVAGMVESYEIIKNDFLQIILILAISCIAVMFVTCKITDYLIDLTKGKANND